MASTVESLLIVYGGTIRDVLLLVTVITGPLLLRWRIRRSRRCAALQRRDALGSPRQEIDDSLRGEVVTLGGPLQAVGRCPSFERGRNVAASTAASRRSDVECCSIRPTYASLMIDSGEVSLEGPMEVVAGSRERWTTAPLLWLSSSIRQRIKQAGGMPQGDAVMMRSVVSGDVVRVRGVLAKDVDEIELGYRVGSANWQLLPAPPDGEVAYEGIPWLEVAAEAPRRSSGFGMAGSSRASVATALLCLLGPVVLYGLFFALGGYLALSMRGSGTGVSPTVLAVATFSRAAALDRLSDDLENRDELSERDIAHAIALSRASSNFDVRGLVHRLARDGEINAADQLARELQSSELLLAVAERSIELGQFQRAGELRSLADPAPRQKATARVVVTDLLAGRHAVVHALRRRCGYDGIAAHCALSMEDVYEFEVRLQQIDDLSLAGALGRDLCHLIHADQREGNWRLDVLETCQTCASSPETAAVNALLTFEALLALGCPEGLTVDGVDRCAAVARQAAESLAHLSREGLEEMLRPTAPAAPPGLEMEILKHLAAREELDEPTRALRAEIQAGVAAFALAVGDMDDARSLAAAAIEDARAVRSETGDDRLDYAIALAVVVEVRDGRFQAAETTMSALSSSTTGHELGAALTSWLTATSAPLVDLVPPASLRGTFDMLSKERSIGSLQGELEQLAPPRSRPFDAYAGHPSEFVDRHLAAEPSDESGRENPGLELDSPSLEGQTAFPYDLLLRTSRELAAAEAMGDEADAERLRSALVRMRRALLRRSTSVLVHTLMVL